MNYMIKRLLALSSIMLLPVISVAADSPSIPPKIAEHIRAHRSSCRDVSDTKLRDFKFFSLEVDDLQASGSVLLTGNQNGHHDGNLYSDLGAKRTGCVDLQFPATDTCTNNLDQIVVGCDRDALFGTDGYGRVEESIQFDSIKGANFSDLSSGVSRSLKSWSEHNSAATGHQRDAQNK